MDRRVVAKDVLNDQYTNEYWQRLMKEEANNLRKKIDYKYKKLDIMLTDNDGSAAAWTKINIILMLKRKQRIWHHGQDTDKIIQGFRGHFRQEEGREWDLNIVAVTLKNICKEVEK